MAGINPQVKTVRNLSPVFYIAFAVVKKYADYSIVIKSARSVHFSELASDFQALKIYLDALLDYRLKTYVSLVRFRGFIIALCQQHGVEFEPSYFRTFVLGKGGNIGLHRGFFAGVNDPKGNATIRDKHATNIFLQQMGVNVNRSREFMLSQLDDQDFINTLELDYPLVLKPTNKKMGYGVVTNILNAESMLSSVRSLKSLGDIEPVLVEEFFLGVTYRVLVIGTEVNAVLKFMPTYIIGNGVNTILELIRSKNRIIRSRIRINDALQLSIENDGYSWDTILPEGYKYTLSHNSHASMGGQATNVTNVFSTKYKKISLQVCSMLGLKHAGIDMNINETGEYRVLEVNSAPALSTHLLPKYGTSIDTYSSVFENLLNNTDVDRVDNRYLQELIKYHQ
jgi:D-alanine-D-alanine ligase-like ATP-grasp enzyme